MPAPVESFSRYLPISSQSALWGWHLVDAGRQQIPAGASYPGKGHPHGYLFDATGRRILNEYQIVHLESGGGTFSSASVAACTVEAGDSLLLFPGEWHRYAPHRETGWNEYWVGFGGVDAERVMGGFFTPARAVLRSGHGDELLRLFDQLIARMAHPLEGGDQLLASFVPMILAFLRAGPLAAEASGGAEAMLILEAKMKMLAKLESRTDLEALARELGTSYSRLRSLFKKQTGLSPRAFENRVKLGRARDLLASGQRNVSSVASILGYSSVYYFSRAFRKAFGQSPQQWAQSRRRRLSESGE